MELRKDYIQDRWVIINPERGKRPHEFRQRPRRMVDSKNCFFCPGKEDITSHEVGRISDGKGGWKMRWFDNKFPVVKLEGDHEIVTEDTYFTHSNAYGKHEVIVEINNHKKQLWDLDESDIKQVFQIYKQRTKELSQIPGIKYVSIFKNHGSGAGASIAHSHSQVIAYNKVPNSINRLVAAVSTYTHCPYCDILDIESKGERRVWEDKNFVAFCPYASRFNYEVWVFPKRHVSKIYELTGAEFTSLSRAMKYLLEKLKFMNAEFNYFLNYSPDNDALHFHIRINPRFAIWAGFEFGTDSVINSVSPEDAAAFYRGDLAKAEKFLLAKGIARKFKKLRS